MNKIYYVVLGGLYFLAGCKPTTKHVNLLPDHLPKAPVAQVKDSAITVHNDTRIDPYFWMRLTDEQKYAKEPDKQTQQVLSYLEAENVYKDSVLKNTHDLQEKLYNEIVGRIKKDDETVPYFSNGYWHYVRYEKDNEYPVYCRKKETLENPEEVILNVNDLAKGHEYYAVGGVFPTKDNNIIAYTEDTLSRRIYTVKFKDLRTGKLLKDEIKNCEPRGAWANDNQTFFYTTKNKISLLSEKIWRHQLGTETSNDKMVYHEKDPSYYIGVYKSKSNKYIIIYSSSTLVSDYQILNADNPTGEFKSFTPRGSNHEYSIYHGDHKFYILTNYKAKNFRLMETPEDSTDIKYWKEIIGNRNDVQIENIDVFKDYLVISERKNALPYIRIIGQKTNVDYYPDFKEDVYVANTTSNYEYDTPVLRYNYSSMTTPSTIIDYNMDTKKSEVKKVKEVVGGHNPDNYITKREWAIARDGKKVPISIVYKKGTPIDGTAPMILYGYGSYGYNITPGFSSTRLSLLDRGFIYAIAHIRGSETMGREWYEDGKMMHKLNTFNDFIDCSKYLIDQKYTSTNHLYAMGGSAGGLLMGAIANMAPELYNGIIADVPFVDVVSTMLDESIPLTTNEFDQWGNPKNKDAYDYIMKYSPYDNVKPQDYPNMLITTGLFDSQVQYWEPAKWCAKLRSLKTDDNILIMDINMDAGHGGASGRFKSYKETALKYAFIFMLEGMDS